MKRRWLAVALLAVLFVSLVLVVVSQRILVPHEHASRNVPQIRIEGDRDFDAGHGVVGGSGAISNPYVIEGWEINVSLACPEGLCAGIIVQNATASFVIENVTVRGGVHDNGIWLSSVKNARVESGSIVTGGDGIHVEGSTNVTLSGNTVAEAETGIFLTQSQDVLVYANSVLRGSQGIVTEDSSRISLLGNILNSNNANGFVFLHVTNSTIEGNMISKTAFRGIALFNSSDITASRNRILRSGEDCLYVAFGGGTSVIQNEVSNCTWTGVSVYGSDENVIKGNFVRATPSGVVVSDSSRNVIASNTVTDTGWGITVASDSQANFVLDNTVSLSAFVGIMLIRFDTQSPDRNVIQGNRVSQSGKEDLLDSSGGSSNLWRFNTYEKELVLD
jgi:parallel beta-helix repeat protein